MSYPAASGGTCCKCGGAFYSGERVTHKRNDGRPYVERIMHERCSRSWREAHAADLGAARQATMATAGVGGDSKSGGQSQEGSGDGVDAPAADRLADALADVLAGRLRPEVDAERIGALVRAEVERAASALRASMTLRVEVQAAGETRSIEGAHYLMPRLLRLMGAGLHVYLWGPAGTGKTTAAIQAARALGRECEVDTLDPSTPRSAVLGYRNLDKTPAETAFSRCWQAGAVYVADECDNAPAYVQTLFNSALANGHAPLAWGSVPRAEGFAFVATGNTPGRPTAAFPDRRPMSAAFADRLYFVEWPLDPAIECRAGGLPVPDAPTRKVRPVAADAWVGWVQAVREWARQNAPTLMVTPRASLVGLVALAAGESAGEVAAGLVFRGADADLVRKVLAAVALP